MEFSYAGHCWSQVDYKSEHQLNCDSLQVIPEPSSCKQTQKVWLESKLCSRFQAVEQQHFHANTQQPLGNVWITQKLFSLDVAGCSSAVPMSGLHSATS